MNKRFSTLLAAALVAGSFSSTYAQLDGRNVEWKDAQANRAYYLVGTHFNSVDYVDAFTIGARVEDARTAINANATQEAAQWTVETKTVGNATYYSFKNIKADQYLAFQKDEAGDYKLASKKDAANDEKSFRWFALADMNGNKNYLKAVLPCRRRFLLRIEVGGW